jgi:pectate lyase
MNFKYFILVCVILTLTMAVGFFWGCEKNAPTAPQIGENMNTALSKTRAAEGFGSGATGGSGGTTVTVSNASDFLDYIGRSGSYIIRVNGTINLSGMNDVASNKTIEGVGTSGRVTGGGLDVDGVSNVIIRNIAFSDWDDDAINVQDGSRDVWVDHCEFSNGYDGCVDIKRGSDYITVSWNHFHNHGKTCLLGHSDDNGSQDAGHLRVTYHHNYFDGTGSRHPRVRFSALCHVYNNYYRNNEYGVASTCDAEVLVENNYFENCDDPTLVGYASSPEGDLVERGNVFSNCENGPETRGSVPSPSYSYSLDDASSVPNMVRSGAGLDGGGTTTTTTSWNSTTTTSGYTTTTTGGGSNSIVLRARGVAGSEHIYLEVGGNQIGDWTVSTSYQNYSASTNNTGDISVCFDNDDGENRDVQVDYITINGETRQAEDQSYNTGVWQDGSCGGEYSEWLHCEGCIGFGDVSGGGSTTSTTTSWSSTTTSGGYTTTTSGGGSNSIAVRARGEVGDEHIYLEVDGNQIADWTVSTSYQNYTASTDNTGGINVCFDNDSGDRDVQIDYIEVNGETRQAEDQEYNTGAWANNECGGGSYTEWLHCDGCIGFGDVSGGGGSTTSTSGGYTSTTTTSGSSWWGDWGSWW